MHTISNANDHRCSSSSDQTKYMYKSLEIIFLISTIKHGLWVLASNYILCFRSESEIIMRINIGNVYSL